MRKAGAGGKPGARKIRVARTRAGGEWTEAYFWGYLRRVLRSGTRNYPPIVRQALEAAREPCPEEMKRGRRKWVYRCAGCGRIRFRDQVEVDHIEPAGSLRSWDDLPEFARRLYCEPDGLRILCKTCHGGKTRRERKERR